METENKQQNTPPENALSVKATVLQKIETREVSMRSKKYFAWKAAALIALSVVALVLTASIFNFIFFNLRINEHGYLLAFGPQGFWLFLKVFPWGMLVLDILLIILLEWLLRNFRFAYRIPSLYLLLCLVSIAALIGFSVDRGTPLNDRMLDRADSHHLPPPLNNFYSNFRQSPPSDDGECDCVVTAINGNTLTAYQKNDPDSVMTIIVPPNDPTLGMLSVGDSIFAGGDFHDGVLHAFGLRKTDAGPVGQGIPLPVRP